MARRQRAECRRKRVLRSRAAGWSYRPPASPRSLFRPIGLLRWRPSVVVLEVERSCRDSSYPPGLRRDCAVVRRCVEARLGTRVTDRLAGVTSLIDAVIDEMWDK